MDLKQFYFTRTTLEKIERYSFKFCLFVRMKWLSIRESNRAMYVHCIRFEEILKENIFISVVFDQNETEENKNKQKIIFVIECE